jgi:AraC-like DNA-binding protein
VLLRDQFTTIGSVLNAVVKALDSYGVSAPALLSAAGLARPISNDPLVRISTQQLHHLFALAVEASGDPQFGLTVARQMHFLNLHAVGYALAASETQMDFLRRLERFMRLITDAVTLEVRDLGEVVELRVHSLMPPSDVAEDAFVGCVIVTMRTLSHDGFAPRRVELRRVAPAGLAPYVDMFKVEPRFGCEQLCLAFDRRDVTARLPGASAELAQVNDLIASKYLARLERGDVVTRTRHKIMELLPKGDCSRDTVARAMDLSPASLRFKLHQRSTSFQQLLDDTRRELACQYLLQLSLSVTEVAYLLGFNDTSNFARAFKRWTGCSPSAFRDGEAGVAVIGE